MKALVHANWIQIFQEADVYLHKSVTFMRMEELRRACAGIGGLADTDLPGLVRAWARALENGQRLGSQFAAFAYILEFIISP